MTDEPREIPVEATATTVEKVTPAVEGDVTPQQLLDAMAHMARDIDRMREDTHRALEHAGQATMDAHRLVDEMRRTLDEAKEEGDRQLRLMSQLHMQAVLNLGLEPGANGTVEDV